MAITRAKFHEKAVFIYALTQTQEGVPVVSSTALQGTYTIAGVTVTGTNTTFKTGTSPVTQGCYLQDVKTGFLIGQVLSVSSDTSIILVANTVRTSTSFGNALKCVLGPNNVVAALNLNFSIDLTTEAFQYAGDELARDETTIITDKIGKFDFESFLPSFSSSTTGNNTGNVPYKSFFEACGFSLTDATADLTPFNKDRMVVISNKEKSNKFLTVEIRRASQDLDTLEKVYSLTDVRGTVDIDSTIGTKAKLKWNMQGNFDGVKESKKWTNITAEDTYLSNIKKQVATSVNSDTITSAKIINLNSTSWKITFPTSTALAVDNVVTLGSLTFTVKSGTKWADLIDYLSNIKAGDTPATLNTRFFLSADATATTGYFGGSAFTDKYNTRLDSSTYSVSGGIHTSIWVDAVIGGIGSSTFTATYKTSASLAIDGFTNQSYPPTDISYSSDIQFCFDKISFPNASGYEYTRYKTGCNDGWSKGAVPTDVSLTIVEDAAGALFSPYGVLENTFNLWFAYKSGDGLIAINLDNIQLTNVAAGKVATYMGQDLTFRNIGNTTLYIKGMQSS